MVINTEPLKDWFGFSRRERRASLILLVIIVLVFLLRYTVPASNVEIKYQDSDTSKSTNSESTDQYNAQTSDPSIKFNPNTASFDTLISIGLAPREANNLINYRKAGGRFRKPADIKKIYGIDSIKADKIIPLVVIQRDTIGKGRISYLSKEKPLLDLNTCDSSALDRLPGIGRVLSVRIIKFRQFLGGFALKEQLKEVYGLSPETYKLIENRVFADSLAIMKISINSADYKKLSRIPYLEKYEVTAILKYRELKGKINGISDLVENKLVQSDRVEKMRPYLRFD
jgi:competence protein ComEA